MPYKWIQNQFVYNPKIKIERIGSTTNEIELQIEVTTEIKQQKTTRVKIFLFPQDVIFPNNSLGSDVSSPNIKMILSHL